MFVPADSIVPFAKRVIAFTLGLPVQSQTGLSNPAACLMVRILADIRTLALSFTQMFDRKHQ